MSSEEIIIRSKFPSFAIPNVSVGEFIYKTISNYDQEQIILVDLQTEEKLTIAELISRANSVATSLVKHGITKDDLFFFDGFNSIPYAVTFMATFLLGNTITTSKPTHNVYEVSNQIANSRSSVVFTANSLVSIVKEAIDGLKEQQKNIKLKICFDGEVEGFLSYETLLKEGQETAQKLPKIPYFDIDPKNDIASIMYTSGTTGLPKGAMNTHYAHVGALVVCLQLELMKKHGAFSMHYPFGHVSGMIFYQICLVLGMNSVLIGVPTIDKILSGCEKYKVTFLGLFPGMGDALLSGEYDKYDLSSATRMSTGGATINGSVAETLIKKYNLEWFRLGYGMTETFHSIINIPTKKWIPGDVGRLSPHMEMKIVDIHTGKSLGPNQDGEICFRGPLMFKGYLNNEEATANTIDKDGWLHSGDVGHYNEDEHIFITGRIKEIIKFRHFSVFPAEIEACLLEHEGITEVVVIGVKHKTEGEWIRAYVKVKEGKQVNENDIHKYMKERMGDQKQLRAGVVFVDSIPRTVIGKTDRQHFIKLTKDEIVSQTCD